MEWDRSWMLKRKSILYILWVGGRQWSVKMSEEASPLRSEAWIFGELKDVPDPQELENGSQMNSVNEEMNVSV